VLLVREDDQGRVVAATRVQVPGAVDARYAAARDAPDLGATPLAGGTPAERTAFALWAPTARRVSVCVYADARGAATHQRPLRPDPATGIWRDTVAGVGHGRPYRYLVDVFVPGAGVVRNRVTDPYSLGLTANSARSVVLDLRHPSTKPAGWDGAARPAALAAPTDLTVYELHVRDFSAGDTTVRAPWRGKFLAFTEAASDGMRHLRALAAAGITDVHLLPVYDLASVPEVGCVVPAIPRAAPDAEAQQAAVSAVRERDCFNWGYDPFHYTAPEGSYATAPDDAAARSRELRAMVMALHAAGLRVGMDVVYNHTFASGQDPRSVLDRVVPGYYHRLDADGRIARSTCCENTATEHAMMGKLMIESAAAWVRHYRLDSFRFDLMGHQPRAVMERLQAAVDAAAGRRVPMLGEGWDFGEVAGGARFVQASQRSLPGSGIATFSDRARDALRGGGCCDGGAALVAGRGLLSGLADGPDAARERRGDLLRAADLARVGLAGTLRAYEMTGADGARRPLAAFDYAGQPAGYAAQPGEVVNYVENHDNLTLFDLLALRLPRDISREQRARAQVLGVAFTAFSQGVAYLHAGVELLRSKSLDRDSFDSGDWFNRIDWTFRDNGFGGGVPPRHRNAADWPWMKPALADARIAPTPAEIRWARGASLDLLRIRRSSTLFRLRTADDVRRRLHFRNVGPAQDPAVLVGHLDGAGYPGAAFREVLYLVNVAGEARTVTLPEEARKAYVLHPVHRAPTRRIARRATRARTRRADASRSPPGRRWSSWWKGDERGAPRRERPSGPPVTTTRRARAAAARSRGRRPVPPPAGPALSAARQRRVVAARFVADLPAPFVAPLAATLPALLAAPLPAAFLAPRFAAGRAAGSPPSGASPPACAAATLMVRSASAVSSSSVARSSSSVCCRSRPSSSRPSSRAYVRTQP
jgi:pullulanase/glycogen debranching enzyme